MSSEDDDGGKKGISISVGDGWNGFWVMIAILVVFCKGDPDLLDVIIAWVARQP